MASKDLNIEELKLIQERYELALKGSSVGIWDWDLKTDELYASPLCLEMLGMPLEEFNYRFSTFIDHLHPEDVEMVMQAVKEHLEKRTEYRIDYRLRNHTTGKYHWIHARGQAMWDQEGKPIRMLGSIEDISEKKKAELELKENEEALEYLHNIGADLKMSVHDKIDALIQKHLERTHSYAGSFGIIQEDLFIVRNARGEDGALIPGDYFELSESPVWPVVQKKDVVDIEKVDESPWKEHPFFKKRGVKSYIGIPVFVRGNLYGALFFYSLIEQHTTTEKRSFLKILAGKIEKEISIEHYEQFLKDEKIKAEEASRAKTLFLQNISHEIRTPMNGILGMTQLLMDSPLSNRQVHYAEGVINSGQRLLQIINDILDLSNLDSGKIILEEKPFDLKDTVEALVEKAYKEAQEKGLNLSLNFDAKAPRYFIGDERRVRQILENLISNALKFTDKGHIAVSVELTRLDQGSAEFKVSVEDTGIGVSKDIANKIFKKFIQADSSTTKKFSGLGIGLAICKELVALLKGDIGVDSTYSGSTFWFTMKLRVDPQKEKVKIP